MKVHLNLFDLYKMAKYLKYDSTAPLFQKGFLRLVQKDQNYWIPQILFKKWTIAYCPFLINSMDENEVLHGLCSLHPDSKPLICSMAPLGRIIDFQTNNIEYCITSPLKDCPGMNQSEEHSIKNIIDEHSKELKYQYEYYQLLDSLTGWLASKEIYLREIYFFSVILPFEEVFSSIKEKAKIIIQRQKKSITGNSL